jgi:hypothetical protein
MPTKVAFACLLSYIVLWGWRRVWRRTLCESCLGTLVRKLWISPAAGLRSACLTTCLCDPESMSPFQSELVPEVL